MINAAHRRLNCGTLTAVWMYAKMEIMRLGEKFKHEFKWHLLTAFLFIIVKEIFNDGFQRIVPTLIALVVGTILLGLFLFIGNCFVGYLVDGVFKGLERIKSGKIKNAPHVPSW